MIVLVGESGSGKSSIEKELISNYGYSQILLHTTRPMRSNEQEGIDYHFSGMSEFNCRQKQNEFAAVTKYNDWYYGVPKDEITDNSVLVTTPCCIKQLKRYAENICVFYIKVPHRDRLIKIPKMSVIEYLLKSI